MAGRTASPISLEASSLTGAGLCRLGRAKPWSAGDRPAKPRIKRWVEPREQTSPAPAFSLSIPPKDPPLIGNRHFWLFEEGQPSSHESSLGSSWRHLAVKALQFAGTPGAPGEPWAGLKSVLAASSSSLHSQIGCYAALGFLQDSGLCKQIPIPCGKWLVCLWLPRGRASASGGELSR